MKPTPIIVDAPGLYERFGKCRRIGVTILSNPLETTSIVARLAEEYGVDCILVIQSPYTAGRVLDIARGYLAELWPLPLTAITRIDPGDPVEHASELLAKLCSVSSAEGLVVALPQSTEPYATALAVAASSTRCRAGVVQQPAATGPWRGLAYPLVPRLLEPLVVLKDGIEPSKPFTVRFFSPSCLVEKLWSLPRLRRGVALLSYLLNSVAYRVVANQCPKLIIDIGDARMVVDDACNAREWAEGVHVVVERLLSTGFDERLVGMAGFYPLIPVRGGDGVVREKRYLVMDTRLVDWGVHVDAYSGASIAVPYCVFRELYERARTRSTDPLGRLSAIIAEELLYAGVHVIPSQLAPCDTLIPFIEHGLLHFYEVMGSSSSLHVWRQLHDSIASGVRVAEPVMGDYAAILHQSLVDNYRDRVAWSVFSRLMYSFLQLLVIAHAAGLSIVVQVEANGRRQVINLGEALSQHRVLEKPLVATELSQPVCGSGVVPPIRIRIKSDVLDYF